MRPRAGGGSARGELMAAGLRADTEPMSRWPSGWHVPGKARRYDALNLVNGGENRLRQLRRSASRVWIKGRRMEKEKERERI